MYPSIGRDAEGLRRLLRQFSFPGGSPSHAAPETPGSIHAGGELGYSLANPTVLARMPREQLCAGTATSRTSSRARPLS